MPRSKPKHPHGEEVRLQSYLARAGVASRRHSEELIASGRVSVNGASVTAPGTKVRPGVDRVAVDGEPVEEQPTTWIALHKPRGYVTTRHDPYGRRTVYELLPEKFHGLFHVGRLDRDSEGVLLLTNEGELANRMLHPSHGITKEYHADVEGRPAADEMHRLTEGVEVDGETFRAESVRRLHQVDENVFRLEVVLREGKKREVRRMLESVGHPVKRLIRRRFGPIALGELPPSKWRVVTPAELASLRSGRAAAKPRKADRRPEDEAGGERPPRRSERTARAGARERDADRPPRGTKPAAGARTKPGPRRSDADARPAGRAGAKGKPGARSAPPRDREEAPVSRFEKLKPSKGKSARRGDDRRPTGGAEKRDRAARPDRGGEEDRPRSRFEKFKPAKLKPARRGEDDRPPARTEKRGRGDDASSSRGGDAVSRRAGEDDERPRSRFEKFKPAKLKPSRRGEDDRPSARTEKRGRGDDASSSRGGDAVSRRAGEDEERPRSRFEKHDTGAKPKAPRGRPGPRASDDDRPPRRSGAAPRDRDERPSARPGGKSKAGPSPRAGGKPGGKGGERKSRFKPVTRKKP